MFEESFAEFLAAVRSMKCSYSCLGFRGMSAEHEDEYDDEDDSQQQFILHCSTTLGYHAEASRPLHLG